MYKNKAGDGENNICGRNLKRIRKGLVGRPSQRILAEMFQRYGLDLDKNAVQRIESGQRFVTDIELQMIARILGISYENLLD